ncbi:right-handed parallel beta-helix repeat-containing protein [Elizabethkingia miricola]|uniref:right-handed parallel beta-helix repeat-containing protein n=1 Tax=Elizabethkingia miricola TaxID=172045 RepID=UPI00389268B3
MDNVVHLEDSASGAIVSFKVVTTWFDGSVMDDSKTDGFVYRKKADKYYCDVDFLTGSRLSCERFGVSPLHNTDVSLSFQKMLDIASKIKAKILVSAGTYYLKSHVDDYQGNYLHDNGGISIKSNTDILFQDAVLKALPTKEKQYNVVRLIDAKNVKIDGLVVHGERNEHIGNAGGEWGYGIYIQSSENVQILNSTFRDCWGDGINIQINEQAIPCKNIDLINVFCDNNRRQGMSIESGVGIRVLNSTFSNTNGTAPCCGVDIEPWGMENIVDNIVFDNCRFVNNDDAGLLVMGDPVTDVRVINCYFKGNGKTSFEGQFKTVYADKLLFSGNTVYESKNIFCGILNASKSAVISNNRFIGRSLIFVDFSGRTSKNVIVENNLFNINAVTWSALVFNGENFTIKGNTFSFLYTPADSGTASSDSFYFKVKGLNFSNNILQNNFAQMTFDTCSGVDISNNTFDNTQKKGLLIHNCSTMNIRDNVFAGIGYATAGSFLFTFSGNNSKLYLLDNHLYNKKRKPSILDTDYPVSSFFIDTSTSDNIILKGNVFDNMVDNTVLSLGTFSQTTTNSVIQ